MLTAFTTLFYCGKIVLTSVWPRSLQNNSCHTWYPQELVWPWISWISQQRRFLAQKGEFWKTAISRHLEVKLDFSQGTQRHLFGIWMRSITAIGKVLWSDVQWLAAGKGMCPVHELFDRFSASIISSRTPFKRGVRMTSVKRNVCSYSNFNIFVFLLKIYWYKFKVIHIE